MDVAVKLKPSDNATAISESMQNFNMPSTGAAKKFINSVTKKLEAKSVPVPPALRTAEARVSAPQAVTMTMPVPTWLASGWAECPTKCGEDRRTRTLSCSVGNSAACDAMGVRPQTIEACKDYSDCPFDIFCFLGPGSNLDCNIQALMAIAVFALLGRCFWGDRVNMPKFNCLLL